MNEKKIVSIEDRIPTLKQARKKKENRRLIFYIAIFFVLIAIIVYLQTPLSDIHTLHVTGNQYISDDDILAKSGLTTDTNIWSVNKASIEQAIEKHPVVADAEVDRQLPWTVHIRITEYERVGYVKQDESFSPLLENGVILDSVKLKSPKGDAPTLFGFTEKAYLNRMTNELKKLPDAIRGLISEIYWNPTDGNKNKIMLYMNDGFVVDGVIRRFADRMEAYPSIVSQLDSKTRGIVHIGVGAYFEAFETDEEEVEANAANSED
ncbi:MAG TPA: cell division protein FtsQ/DivIB [Bacillota bacterium]|nr:cell division protein FtsQ/DivIB [Bacillota bacterium]